MLTSQRVVEAFIAKKGRQIGEWEDSLAELTRIAGQTIKDKTLERFPLNNASVLTHSRIKECKNAIGMLKNLPSGPFTRVSLGCLVYVHGREGLQAFLIVSHGGGCNIVVEGQAVSCMSIGAPVAQALLGKAEGELVFCNGCYAIATVD